MEKMYFEFEVVEQISMCNKLVIVATMNYSTD